MPGIFLAVAFVPNAAFAQAEGIRTDWRHIGNSAIELGLPSAATGPVDRVWYSSDGARLFARAHNGRIFESVDLETWKPAPETTVVPPVSNSDTAPNSPEAGALLRVSGTRLYAFSRNAFRSDDGGDSWLNLTAYHGASILGSPISDFAVSPASPDEITVANAAGVWRSTDAGLTWSGLNTSLPNLPVRRIFVTPGGTRGVRITLGINGTPELEWGPGEKTAWRVSDSAESQRETELKQAASQALKTNITAVAASGDTVYAGSADGQLWGSSDKGATWGPAWATVEAGPVENIFADPKDPRTAIAVFGARSKPLSPGVQAVHVMRTLNSGLYWDDSTANLADVAAHGVALDRSAGAVYVATDAGVFFTAIDSASGRTGTWTRVSEGLPNAAATDVKLDAGANQLYAALDGYGVYAAIAPHRFRNLQVVNAADYSARPAAPGSLLSVLGAHVTSAQVGSSSAPVLATDASGTQIQVPFDATGQSVALALQMAQGQSTTVFPLRQVSPAIFVGSDGAPMILDADSGEMLDASNTAHSGSRIQILATGLGRVDPDWATGLPGPVANPPRVVAGVHAYLDQNPVEVSRAVLAPYVGFYLIEIQLPRIVNAGPAEIYIEADGQPSNKVRLYIAP